MAQNKIPLSQVAETVAAEMKMNPKEVEETLRKGFDAVARLVAGGDKLTVPGFGTFSSMEKNGREMRNPANGESVQIPARIAPHFRAGAALKRMVAEGDASGTTRRIRK